VGRWARRGRARRPPPRRAPRICNDRYNSRFEITYNIHNNLVPPTGGTFELAKARIAAVLSTQLAPLCSAPRCQAVSLLSLSRQPHGVYTYFSLTLTSSSSSSSSSLLRQMSSPPLVPPRRRAPPPLLVPTLQPSARLAASSAS
jgi:hypothetical protein